MKISIEDFRKYSEEKKNETIYNALITLAHAIQFIPDGKLPIGTILPFKQSKEMKLPEGYEICNGQNITDDLSASFTAQLIYIQRVR